ncbi:MULTISPECIES: 3'-5' exonuclease [unclassified Acinetobacter]|uniref:3'-5' exonuclease n=1 Tax=unclassified Acinetobacter TaxID=196816 RepID=UPI0029351559|nr:MULTISPECIES: 3'-5' exonuclease [unclassified Acinetobacter]WOE30599.1 AAA family ATPase [Acinetobacter sp. SAAs470]WOE38791.1 AAA family ATPase [Acinetobacter sp. SAAs474]
MTQSSVGHTATYEQAIAIDNARLGESFKVVAYAGTGKTTTLQMMSDAMPRRRGMYLAFNKSIATEAQHKFAANVDCRTFHSLAFRSVPRGITDKLRLPRLSPSFLAKEYALVPLTLRRMMGGRYEKYVLMPSRLASLVADAVSYFCSTSSQYPAPRHVQAPNWLHPDDIDSLQKYLYPAVERRWLESIDPHHQAGIGHDIYLKLWALSEPNIPTDYILFDEAQDADPLMLGILLRQRQTQVIYVGDAHQQIYAWRGAINAMQQLPLPESRLTTSFRFGAEIALHANAILTALKETVPLLGNPALNSKVVNKPHTQLRDAILCRTNARAMELLLAGLIHGDKVSLQADHLRLNRFVDAANMLKQGKRVIDVPELAWFNSWHDVHEYCETNEGSDIKPLVKLVDDHGIDPLKKALAKITPIDQADYIISTAHKAKGLEWNRVHIEDDYQFKLNQHDHKISPEELRLLYVACTRAKLSLNIHHIYDLMQQLKKQAVK